MGFSSRYNAAEAEHRWQDTWARDRVYEFDPTDPRPPFAIDTPPPTVSGKIHIGHVYSYVQAEAMARFWRMQGRNVYYPFGFDDNGLPTERFVEQLRGIRARDLSRPEFIAACLDVSREFEDRFETFWKTLGMSVDWRLRYSSIDDESRRISQWSFIDLYQKGRVYREQAPNPWCVECQTAIAQAEIDDADRATTFYTLAFGLAQRGQGSGIRDQETAQTPDPRPLIPIATTRPELLPACVAVFVHPDDARFAEMIGREAIVPLFERRVPILADAAVDPDKGTGAVMCCTFGDTTDVMWWRTHHLPLIPLLTRQGRLSSDGGPYTGLSLPEAKTRILADLREKNLILAERAAEQSIRIHERCKQPLEILETQQWFIRVLDAKQELLKAGRQIEWHPAYMRTRYEHWVENLAWDWSISRQRFYGVPFPLWHCDQCGAIVFADQTALPVDPTTDPPPACACGNSNLRPEIDVMDTWATSSVSPQIALLRLRQALGDDESGAPSAVGDALPMDLRPQAHDIIRTWAFYTIVKSHFHYGKLPWKTVMISGHGLDPSGRKLSKSAGNAQVGPEALIARYGADAVRYWACGGALGADQPINEEQMKQGTRLVTKLWNAARFVAGRLDGFDTGAFAPALLPADRALLSWLQRLIARTTTSFQAYDYTAALEATERFFWGTLCDNYLEWVKGRLYDGNDEERKAAQYTLYQALLAILKLFAPILPHITEEIYQHLSRGQGSGVRDQDENATSIHTSAWPRLDDALLDERAERAGAALLAIAGATRRFKSAQQLGLGAELARVTISADDEDLRVALEQSRIDLRSVTRAREIAFADILEGAEEIAPGLWMAIER